MFGTFTEQNVIGRLRIVGAPVDALSARLRASMLLNSASLEAAQPTPSAIVFIRKLRDPLPGALTLDSGLTQPPMEWNRALADSLRELAAKAARPAADNVSGTEEAIIFADRAELLACLATDLCQGTIATRWWWSSFLRTGGVLPAVRKVWHDNPEYIPAALHHLARRNRATAFLRRLGDDAAHQFVGLIAHVFGLQWLSASVRVRLPERASAELLSISESGLARNEEPSEAPWWPQATEAQTSQLSLEHQRFLGIALMIQRAPSVVRTAEFARELERWQELVTLPSSPLNASREFAETLVANAITDTRTVDTPRSGAQLSERSAPRVEGFFESRPIDDEAKPFPVETLPPATASDTAESNDARVIQDGESERGVTTQHTHLLAERLESPQSPSALKAETAQPQKETSPDDLTPSEQVDFDEDSSSVSIETNLGGLFYLISLALYLDLYGDFTSPTAQGLELNIWDFITLAGRELVGNESDDDPIWLLLANLAGREPGDPAGKHFKPERDWRLPREWLQPFKPDQPWRWSASRGRLRVMHPQGFTVLDLSLAGDPREQLQREIEPYEIESTVRARVPAIARIRSRSLNRRVRRWLSLLMPYVRARLRVALGVESHEDIAATLCRCYARVQATDTHVDVFFSLAELPLQIRLAGLDRDPGWVPAAGRFIAFHFD